MTNTPQNDALFDRSEVATLARKHEGVLTLYPARQISQSVNCSLAKAYEFAGNPENIPAWASGLASAKMTRSGHDWVADSPMGKVKIRFAERNSLGVIDHDVTLPNGQTFHNPLRVLKNGTGCEVVFTLYRQPEMSDADFEKDAAAITSDLQKLKSILEK